ncbi:MAG: Holliday junction branch migration protein RuvA [Bacteroidales bacterium]|jgi:Holliday junction DNA helicase RuvA|nr:Holliday junction branch migration protein RuvA [Bacteroidales bacterium]
MYAYLEGNITELNPACAVIDCAGVGYEVNISLTTYSAIKNMQRTRLQIVHIVREDAQLLFGFHTVEEKKMFLLLISVSGIGANTARTILSAFDAVEVGRAILNDDAKKIQSVKGIGSKTAERVIVDLRDKINAELFASVYELDGTTSSNIRSISKDEALAALVTLGYPKNASEKILDKILLSNPECNSEELIKQALRLF